MNALLNKLIPNRKVRIRLVRDDFSSPILGNVWIGREATLNIATASSLVKHGYAVFVDEADSNGLAKPDASSVVTPAKEKTGTELETAQEDDGDDESEPMTLDEALDRLDTEDDSHWTKGGLPDLTVLKEWTGQQHTRKEVEEARPEFNRENAQK